MKRQPPSPPAAAAKVLLFGTPELHAGAVTPFLPERRFQLLALLALHSGQWMPRDRVAALFWPEHGNADARRNLRKVLFNSHGLPGSPPVEANEHALRWTVATDLQDFNRAIAARRFGAAAGLRRGPLLAGIDDNASNAWSDWLAAERSRWHQSWHQAALDDLQQQTRPEQRMAAAEALLQADPIDEAALAALIDAQLALGHAGLARRSYDDYAVRLAEELGVEPARSLRDHLGIGVGPAAPHPSLRATAAGLRNGPAAASAAVPTAATAPPLPGTVFIGRRTELAELGLLLANADCRLLTLLGPGGIGKSSLARRALAAVGENYPGGTWWIELQDLADIPALVARLAHALGVQLSDTRDAIEQLARRLGVERTLLVLDNAENLADLPALVDGLLGAAGSLSLLLTSRARTHCGHESVLPLAGLDVPDEDSHDLDAARHFDAVRLFELRAAAAQRGFSLTRHLPAVIDIVEAVAGMPLAIELAASWVRLLPPEEIARELRSSIDVLERDPALPGEPARPEHRSMRAVLDRSWQLLAPRERQALAALSVFQGGFTRTAAQRVTAAALPLLSSLADKSLVFADPSGRFGLHPLVASHAAQRLEEDPQCMVEMRSKHAEFFALHLAALAPHAIGDQRLLVAGVTAEFANCRAAWLNAVEQQRADLVYAMVRALWSFFENRGRMREGIEWLSPALALPEGSPAAQRALARLHHGLSMLHHRVGNATQALELARSRIAGAEHCGDTEAYVGCVLNTGSCLWFDQQPEEARKWFERGLAIAQDRADRHCIAWSLGNLGNCLIDLGETDKALDCLARALAGSRELGDQYNIAVHLTNIGALHSNLGQWAAARAHFEEGLRHCADFGIESLAMYLHNNMGQLSHRRGDHVAARSFYEAALTRSRERGIWVIEWAAQMGLARVDIATGAAANALHRLRHLVRSAGARSSRSDLAAAASAFGDAKAAQGDPACAAQIWRMLLSQGSLLAAQRDDIERKLTVLRLPPRDASTLPATSLDEVLRQLQDEASPPT